MRVSIYSCNKKQKNIIATWFILTYIKHYTYNPLFFQNISLFFPPFSLQKMAGQGDVLEWYLEIPIVSRTYLTASFITTAACALELVSPFSLYYNFKLIFHEGEVWRLITNFLFFGKFSLEFVFHMYFLMRYCRLLEENSFRGRTSDFVFMLLLSALFMTVSVGKGLFFLKKFVPMNSFFHSYYFNTNQKLTLFKNENNFSFFISFHFKHNRRLHLL